jgi:hypothetical protein
VTTLHRALTVILLAPLIAVFFAAIGAAAWVSRATEPKDLK